MGDLGKKPPYWKTRRPWGRGCPIIVHVVHTQTRGHGSLHKPCKNMESVQLQVMSFFGIRTIFDSGARAHNFLNPLPPIQLTLLHLCGCRCEAATNCRNCKDSKIIPPKSLDSDSTRVPKVSQTTNGKGHILLHSTCSE